MIGKMLKMAGKKLSDNNHAKIMPIAVMLPRCQYGGASEKFRVRKPMIVVTLVSVTGTKFTRKLSIMA